MRTDFEFPALDIPAFRDANHQASKDLALLREVIREAEKNGKKGLRIPAFEAANKKAAHDLAHLRAIIERTERRDRNF